MSPFLRWFRPGLAVSLVLASTASLAGATAMPAAAQSPPRVVLLDYGLAVEEIGERSYVFARGLLRNEGPGPATDVQVKLTLFGEDRSLPLGVGGGHGWLDELDVDETGPFSVAVNHCCLEDIEEPVFEVTAAPAALAPYRALRVEDTRIEVLEGAELLAGDLHNIGGRYVNASSIDVYAAFFDGDRLVRLTTANMPVFFDAFQGDIGQSFPPGHRYPWQIHLPADGPEFSRYEVWSNGKPYSAGVYPVPLGFESREIERVEGALQIRGSIVHCGAEPVQAAAVVLKALDESGKVIAFTRREYESFVPLMPGSRTEVDIRWPEAPTAVDPTRVAVDLHAIASQAQRPLDDFCRPAAQTIFLPRVFRDAG